MEDEVPGRSLIWLGLRGGERPGLPPGDDASLPPPKGPGVAASILVSKLGTWLFGLAAA